jgi:hypothetical protein
LAAPGARFALPGGLRLWPTDWRRAARAGLAAIAGVTAFIALLDGAVFRGALPADYVAQYTSPLWPRMGAMGLAAVREELVFRLGLMTALVWLLSRRGRAPSAVVFVFAIAAAQFVNIADTLVLAPLYGALRFWLVGCVWGWLYWRHGFATALAAHSLCHFALNPVLFGLLGP